MYELISLLGALLVIILGAGFIGSQVCYSIGVEFDGGAWFLSVIITVIVLGIPLLLIIRHIFKK